MSDFIEDIGPGANAPSRLLRAVLLHGCMSRVPVASLAGLCFIVAWISGAAVLADYVFRLPFAVQVVYFAVAGFIWVFPVRWLMLWAAHQR